MRLSSIAVVNRSPIFKGQKSRVLDRIVRAVQAQVERDFAPAWGLAPIPILAVEDGEAVPLGAGLVYLVDRIRDVQGAVGLHKADERGFFCGLVAVDAIAKLGGSLTSGSDSVSSAVSHEVLEMIANASVNYWVEAGDGRAFALEVCDPVSADSYCIDVEPMSGEDGSPVSVSNFVHPSWFNIYAPSGSWFDHMQVTSSPFEVRPTGYAMVKDSFATEPRFGSDVPLPKRDRVLVLGRSVRARDALR